MYGLGSTQASKTPALEMSLTLAASTMFWIMNFLALTLGIQGVQLVWQINRLRVAAALFGTTIFLLFLVIMETRIREGA